MFVPIGNTPRPYAWGSTSAIATLLGTTPSGEPEAELWLGAHPGSASVILDPSATGGTKNLAEWIALDPATTLGRYAASGRLPFLLKVLAAAAPLSLQAHPTPEQAIEGFARENAAGVPLDSPERNYKDAFPKPELIYALSPTFDALCGFRSLESARSIVLALLETVGDRSAPLEELLESLETDDAPRTTFEWLLSNGAGVPALVSLVTELAPQVTGWELEMATVAALAAEYPGDPGIVISLLLNRVRLRAGEALYLPAGNIHAYLDGLGVELMAASDNVLRGGLTPKHVDVPELLSVLDFRTVPVPYLEPSEPSANLEVFRPDVPDFALMRVTGEASWALDGPAIAICTDGAFDINGVPIERGGSVYITPDERELAFTGAGTLFVAMTPPPDAL
jgi:mannose-6-phosphate isomerase